jgi:hypothetical protein
MSRSAYFDGLSITIFEGSYQDRKRASHPAMLMGSEWGFRFRYPRAVERSGSGGGRPGGVVGRTGPDVKGWGKGASWHRPLSLGPRLRRQARRAAKAALPLRALGLDRSTRPKQRAVMPSIRRCASPPSAARVALPRARVRPDQNGRSSSPTSAVWRWPEVSHPFCWWIVFLERRGVNRLSAKGWSLARRSSSSCRP